MSFSAVILFPTLSTQRSKTGPFQCRGSSTGQTKVDRNLRGIKPHLLSTGDQNFNCQNQHQSSQGVRAVTSRVLGDSPPSPSIVAPDQEKDLLSQRPLHPSTQTCLTQNSTGVSREETPIVSSILKGEAEEGSRPAQTAPTWAMPTTRDRSLPPTAQRWGWQMLPTAAQGLFWSVNK